MLHHWQAFLLGDTRIDGTLIDYDVSFGDDFTNSIAGPLQRTQVWEVVFIHGCGNRHNIEITITDFLQIRCTEEAVVIDGVLQEFVGDFQRVVMTCHEGINTTLVQVEADGWKLG